jgi:hypothetical protein
MLSKEDRLRVFENRVLRKIFGTKREEVTGDWRKLRIEELHDLCSSTSIIWVIQLRVMGGTFSTFGGEGQCLEDFGGTPEGKRLLGKHWHR